MAKNAVPIAKNAGLAAKQSAEGAVARAAPRVKDARVWAAPHVEQAGLAVRDKIAPAISDALVEAAHRLDDSAPRRRRWPRVLAGVAMVAAAGSAIAAAVLRRRPASMDFGTATAHGATDDSASPMPSSGQTSTGPADAEEEEAKANGRIRSTS